MKLATAVEDEAHSSSGDNREDEQSRWPGLEAKDQHSTPSSSYWAKEHGDIPPPPSTLTSHTSMGGRRKNSSLAEQNKSDLPSGDQQEGKRSQSLQMLEEIELSGLQQWIAAKQRTLGERSKRATPRETSVGRYSGTSKVGASQQLIQYLNRSLEHRRDGP